MLTGTKQFLGHRQGLFEISRRGEDGRSLNAMFRQPFGPLRFQSRLEDLVGHGGHQFDTKQWMRLAVASPRESAGHPSGRLIPMPFPFKRIGWKLEF